MAKFKRLDESQKEDITYVFQCPGCKDDHYVRVKGNGCTWEWNGDVDKPTVSPSLLLHRWEPGQVCHSFVKDGQIQFLNDCFHELRGKTVDIPEWDD